MDVNRLLNNTNLTTNTLGAAATLAPLRADAQLFVAYADGGLHSDVRAGENRGVRLSHERVVRALRLAATPDAQGRLHARLEIPKPREAGTGPLLVAFVQRRSNGDVLQTMTLPLDGCTAN